MAFDCNRAVQHAQKHYMTDPGCRLQEQYKLTYNEDGTKDLIVCGHVDIYDMIQSHADSVDVHKIVERCVITGDNTPLLQREGFFGDLASMPKNRFEALQMLADAENAWNQLPVEVKKKFDNNMDIFFATAFTDEWIEKVNDFGNKVVNGEVVEKRDDVNE